MNTPILPGGYGERIGSGGSPTGALGTQLIAVVGRGDKAISSPAMLAPSDMKKIKTTGGPGWLTSQVVFYKITAYNDQGETMQTQEVTVTVAGTGGNPHSALVKWNLVRGAKGYKIYRSLVTGVYGASSLLVNIVGAGTSYEDAADTLSTGQPPASGGALWMPYNTPTLFFSMSQIRDYFGAGTALGKASIIAERLNLSRLMVVSVDYTTVDPLSGQPRIDALALAYQTALESLDMKYVDIVCTLEAEPAVTSKLSAHIDRTFGNDPKSWRVGFAGSGLNDTVGDGVTSGTITANARAVNRNKVLVTAPNSPYLSYYEDDGSAVTSELQDGSMMAFAAACMKATVGDDAEQITNRVMAVFDKFGKDFNHSELEYLVQSGVTPFITDAPGQQRCIKGLTTSLATLEDASISITMADLRVGKEVVATASEFIGKKITQPLLDSAYEKVGKKLQSLTGTILTSFNTLEVFQDEVQPNWLIVRFKYRVMYTTDVIQFEWQYDTATGAALRRT